MTASWVIVRKDTGAAVFETYNENMAHNINKNMENFKAVPIMEYLTKLNAAIKESGNAKA